MTRRDLLKRIGAAIGGSLWAHHASLPASETESGAGSSAEGQIMTVTGPIAPEEMGMALPHEHVLSRFGEPPARRPDYHLPDLFDTLFTTFLPRLRSAGFSEEEIQRLTVENPRRAFTVRDRT